jgi:hypothetical protein
MLSLDGLPCVGDECAGGRRECRHSESTDTPTPDRVDFELR